MAEHTDIYNQIAETYKETWEDHHNPALEELVTRCGTGPILDAGCGPGRDLATLKALGATAIGVDLSENMIKLAARHSGASAVIGDLRSLGFQTATFQGVWASASLVHFDIETAGTALEELARCTAEGGAAHITVKGTTGEHSREGWETQGTIHWSVQRWFRWWRPLDFARIAEHSRWICEDIRLEPDTRREHLWWVAADLTKKHTNMSTKHNVGP